MNGCCKVQITGRVSGKRASHLIYGLTLRSSRWQDVWHSVIKGCNTSKQDQHAVILPLNLTAMPKQYVSSCAPQLWINSHPYQMFYHPLVLL